MRSNETQTFSNVVLWDVNHTPLVIKKLEIYFEKDNEMIPVEISYEDKKVLTDLIMTSKISKHKVRKPSSKTLIVETQFKDSDQVELGFKLYKKNKKYYVSTFPDLTSGRVEWFELRSDVIPDFYLNLLEKTSQ